MAALEVEHGERADIFAARMITEVARTGKPVQGIFNDAKIVADENSSIRSIREDIAKQHE